MWNSFFEDIEREPKIKNLFFALYQKTTEQKQAIKNIRISALRDLSIYNK